MNDHIEKRADDVSCSGTSTVQRDPEAGHGQREGDPCGEFTRRTFIRTAAVGLAAGLTAADTSGSGSGGEENPPLVIDCHAHIYGEDEKKYPTIPRPLRPPQGTGTIEHLKRETQAAGVKYVTAIQTSTYYRWDNRFTADSSRANSDFMAGVCTLNPDDPHSPWVLEHLVNHYNVRGMRSIPAESGRLDDPGVDRLWTTAERLSIVINVLVDRDKRPEVEELATRHPKLRIVIDHCLNLKAGPTLEPTLVDMSALARLKNAHAKLTFIPKGSAEEYPCRDLHAACHTIIKAFGPDRCVWGSAFPCELWCPKVTYAQHLRIFTHELGLEDSWKKKVLGQTAFRLWFQPRGSCATPMRASPRPREPTKWNAL